MSVVGSKPLWNASSNDSISQPSNVVNPESENNLRFSRASQDSTDSAAQVEYHEDGTKLQTKGQRAKFVANNTTDRVYSRTESAAEINRIISEVLSKKYGKEKKQKNLQKLLTRQSVCAIIPSLSEDSRFR